MPVRVCSLSHTYAPGTPFACTALQDVSFVLAPGQIAALLGPTGSGKSTLAQHLNGLIRPPQGCVFVKGWDAGRPADLGAVRRTVGLAFQFPEAQLFEETVWADVAFGPRQLGVSEREVARRVEESLRAVALDPVRDGHASPLSLSGGQRRRAALAGILAMRPEVLILDEPTVGLDPEARRQVLELIGRLGREGGVTILMISHDIEAVAALAERVMVLAGGRLVMDGPARQVLTQVEALQRLGLDAPFAARIAHNLRRRTGVSLPSGIVTLDDLELALAALLDQGGGKAGATTDDPAAG